MCSTFYGDARYKDRMAREIVHVARRRDSDRRVHYVSFHVFEATHV